MDFENASRLCSRGEAECRDSLDTFHQWGVKGTFHSYGKVYGNGTKFCSGYYIHLNELFIFLLFQLLRGI